MKSSPGPHLQTGRHDHKCGRIKSESTGTQMSTIVVGGADIKDAYLSSVEVLRDGSDQWTTGPELPGANFIIILGAHFLFKSVWRSFSLNTFWL